MATATVGNATEAENTAIYALAAATASSVTVAVFVPTVMATRSIHAIDATARENVPIVEVLTCAANAAVSGTMIMEAVSGLNAAIASVMDIVLNAHRVGVPNVTMEYGHAHIATATGHATTVRAADYARGVAETRIAVFARTVMASVILVRVGAICGNTIQNASTAMMLAPVMTTPAQAAAEHRMTETRGKNVNIAWERRNA